MATILYQGCEKGFGEDYPAVLTRSGIRFPLNYETRFIRHYRTPDPTLLPNLATDISRFVDGSASITLARLEAEWSNWTPADRMDFCRSLDDLRLLEQPDLPAMVSFLVYHADPTELSAVAPNLKFILGRDEEFSLLLVALQRSRNGDTANIIQAMGLTKHERAQAVIRQHLEALWKDDSLWDDAEFMNWVAFDAVNSIRYLIELGAPSAEFEERVRELSQHSCRRIREKCRQLFAKHYAWLSQAS